MSGRLLKFGPNEALCAVVQCVPRASISENLSSHIAQNSFSAFALPFPAVVDRNFLVFVNIQA